MHAMHTFILTVHIKIFITGKMLHSMIVQYLVRTIENLKTMTKASKRFYCQLRVLCVPKICNSCTKSPLIFSSFSFYIATSSKSGETGNKRFLDLLVKGILRRSRRFFILAISGSLKVLQLLINGCWQQMRMGLQKLFQKLTNW